MDGATDRRKHRVEFDLRTAERDVRFNVPRVDRLEEAAMALDVLLRHALSLVAGSQDPMISRP